MHERRSGDRNLDALIQKIATGPKLSKSLSREEAREGMRDVLDGGVHPVQAAIFLIALRMKRESDEENLGLLDAIAEVTERNPVDVPQLVTVSEPYDGFSRTLPLAPFLPAVLAACGFPAVSHGIERVAPKYGLTHAQVLRAAGVSVGCSPAAAARQVAEPSLGWAYVDQSRYAPALHRLGELRRLMVKRTALSTLERVAAPLWARGRTHLLAGYVHAAYPRIYARLARETGFHSALMVRGLEGAVTPSLRQPGQAWGYTGEAKLMRIEFVPAEAGIEPGARGMALSESAPGLQKAAARAARAGLAVLGGRPGPARDALVYSAALCLRHVLDAPALAHAAAQARAAIDSGAALERFENARRAHNPTPSQSMPAETPIEMDLDARRA